MAIEVEDLSQPGTQRHQVTLHLHIDQVPDLCLRFNADVPSLDPDVMAAAVMQLLATVSTPDLVRDIGKFMSMHHEDAAQPATEDAN